MYIYSCFKTLIMVGIYCRISGKKEDDKDTSIDTQIEEGIDFATNVIGENYKIYKDIGVSGKAEIEERNDFNQFIKDIQKGEIQHIFAINQSRIERSPKTWQIFVASVLNASAKWYPEGNFYDLDNTTNRLMANMMSIINEFHSDNTSDAVKKAFKKNALKGKAHGIRAYGIKKDKESGLMVHDPKEIEVVKDIFKWSLEGKGAYTIAKELNEAEIPTRYNKLGITPLRKEVNTGKTYTNSTKKWWGSTISGILKNEIFMGVYVWGDERVKLPHLAILTEEEFDKVQKNFKKNKKEKVGKKPSNNYLLNGLLFCKECYSMYKGVIKKKSRDNSYKCKGKAAPTHICKKSRAVNIPRFETFIIQHLFLSKNLQEHLNKIEINNDEIALLQLKVSQKVKSIKSQEKMVTRDYNLMRDPELEYDTRLKDDYQKSKMKLSKLKEELEVLENKLNEQRDNNRLNRVNNIIDGFDLTAGFKPIQESVHKLIERIDITHQPLEKNGIFQFLITYKGFNEKSIWRSNQQLNEYNLVGYHKSSKALADSSENEIPNFYIPEVFQKYMDSSPDKKEYFQSVIDELKSNPVSPAFKGTTQLEFGEKLDVIKIDINNFFKFN